MDTIEMAKLRALGTQNLNAISKEESFVPPWMFRHQDLINKLESAIQVNQKRLINTLNYIHFTEGSVFIYFSHPKYEEGILVKAYPEPCIGDKLICRWSGNTFSNLQSDGYSFQQLIIADGQSILLVPGRIQRINAESLTIELPTAGYDICERKARRYICQDIQADIIQSGIQIEGVLVDFSPFAFCVRVLPETSSPFAWFNVEVPTIVHLRKGKQILFSGLCRCIRQINDIIGREIVLAPVEDTIKRFRSVKIRNPRFRMNPPPSISFNHPFFKRKIKREIHDASNTGFSVYEDIKEGVLMPGMIIPELTIKYAGALEIKCKAQVIYRQEKTEEEKFRCGLAILDMDMREFSKLNQILNFTKDHRNHISNKVDMDALWEFFFDTGFIYPKKYSLIQSYRNDFKETYRKLYQENPEIARHFTYEKNGRIYGHMSMVRAYEHTWLIQHHAGRSMEKKLPGLEVLRQAMLFLHGIYHMPSAKMDYVMCYYSSDNKFPDRTFGGFARELDNPQGCSLDLFHYMPYHGSSSKTRLPEGSSLEESSLLELWKLENFYKYHSGGLLMNVLNLGQKDSGNESLEKVAKLLGFMRKWKAYSLVNKDKLNAVLIVNQSDLGVNLSELLNCIMIFMIDSEGLSWELLSSAVSELRGVYDLNKVPLLIYPSDDPVINAIPYDKQYQMWILDMHHSNQFMQFMQRKFRMRYE